MKISPVDFPYPSPIVASMRAIEQANLTLAEMAESLMLEGFGEDAEGPSYDETNVATNPEGRQAIVVHDDTRLDILV